MLKKIYVTDSDPIVLNQLVTYLNNNSYIATGFKSGLELLFACSKEPCSLIILEDKTPVINGFDLTKEIVKISDIPVIMTSATEDSENIIRAFEAGCDDFFQKPFDVREVTAKIKIILHRISATPEISSSSFLSHNGLELNLTAHTALLNGKPVSFTPKEYSLLILLIKNKNLVFSREQIIQNVWRYDYDGDSRQVDHLVKRLRKKIKQYDSEFQIETVWGLGYKISY